ncbi:DUF1524 domain-containing protein [Streptomyces sp. NBC_00892]|uniref:GmrSD restriction endonuclease domain-containing protein n=1 Tax=Streptomyces sp. NBC_00892 TaxID=2975861 RepID=UPI0022552FF0|nr:DUF1524 domain-containing protein [Streptomyces sp. NBC_00892]MCX4902520.1 DUF3761 domain-containing protein [Streptomyces sp. NBC_00892]
MSASAGPLARDDQCRATSGTWLSEYDGRTIESASGIDIDHIVLLKEAWRSGASRWTTPELRAFANDLIHSQLTAVSAGSNRAKGDKDPARWKPPLESYHCTYSRAWISVEATYHLTANSAEAAALSQMHDTCDVCPPGQDTPGGGEPEPGPGDHHVRTAHDRGVQGWLRPPGGRDRPAKDGTYSSSKTFRGTCSHHGGVRYWYK